MPPEHASGERRTRPAFLGRRGWPLVVVGAPLAIVAAVALAIYAGIYNVAADIPHTQPVYWLLETARERSIAAHAKYIKIPDDLSEHKRVISGAGQYAEMCAGCHLAPGMQRTEIARGLYPRAPELRRGTDLTAAEEFWVVKHGLKMTGMPAWGVTHSDELLWDIVAFLRKLPELGPDEYQAFVKSAPSHHEIMDHTEGDGGHDGQSHSKGP
jgi:mono/diheme cytochrome c family protein